MLKHVRPVAAAILLSAAVTASGAWAQETGPDRPRTFQEYCARCHQHAETLGEQLDVVDGRLRGRYTGRDIREFLAGHGRLDAAGVEFFVDLLSRMARETASGG
jgi:hypothetical protein